MNKKRLITDIIRYLQKELSLSQQAANNAHLAAIDDQSVAETQYDTLAIESAYLAEGQARRVVEFKQAIAAFKQLPPNKCQYDNIITLGSLVQLAQDRDKQHWFFIGPGAAGYRTRIEDHNCTVVTPQSPLGQALLGKTLDDEITIKLANKIIDDDILQIK